jgi:hypothetical protein
MMMKVDTMQQVFTFGNGVAEGKKKGQEVRRKHAAMRRASESQALHHIDNVVFVHPSAREVLRDSQLHQRLDRLCDTFIV